MLVGTQSAAGAVFSVLAPVRGAWVVGLVDTLMFRPKWRVQVPKWGWGYF